MLRVPAEESGGAELERRRAGGRSGVLLIDGEALAGGAADDPGRAHPLVDVVLDRHRHGGEPGFGSGPKEELLGAEHNTVIGLRDEGAIHDEVLHEIERDLDLERVRVGRDLKQGGNA